MGCWLPFFSRLLLPALGSVDGRNPGRLVRRHAEAPARFPLADGPHLPSEPGRKLAQFSAGRAEARTRIRRVDAARRPAHRPALSLPPPHQPTPARIPRYAPPAAVRSEERRVLEE